VQPPHSNFCSVINTIPVPVLTRKSRDQWALYEVISGCGCREPEGRIFFILRGAVIHKPQVQERVASGKVIMSLAQIGI
jgi:hypothetical protein